MSDTHYIANSDIEKKLRVTIHMGLATVPYCYLDH